MTHLTPKIITTQALNLPTVVFAVRSSALSAWVTRPGLRPPGYALQELYFDCLTGSGVIEEFHTAREIKGQSGIY